MEEQQQRHQKWVKEEGGIEHPTHIETLSKPEQKARIRWLKEHCFPATEILDIGCNWGYILNELNGKCGVDLNPENIEKAKENYPLRLWKVGDITKGLPLKDEEYACVVMADILEHLRWFDDVKKALDEGLRIARRKLLITLPYLPNQDFAFCFKHKWIPDKGYIGTIVTYLMKHKTTIECDGIFCYLEVIK